MLTKTILKNIILDQRNHLKLPKKYIKRDLEEKLTYDTSKQIVVITGLRRVGKSTLMLKLKEKLGGDYYLNFDDERLFEFTVKDFQALYEAFLELFGEQDIFYFDEIQNVPGWERFVRRLHDYGKKVYITGSNARLLSPELGTHLTGRYLQYELFPFSFKEFLSFKGTSIDPSSLDTTTKINLINLTREYLKNGGIPEFLTTRNRDILKLLYENILYRDIAARFDITNTAALRELGRYVLSNFATEVSFNKLKHLLGVKSHVTVAKYFQYFQDAYLAFLVPRFAYSVKTQGLSAKKLYTIDTGLSQIAGFNFSNNLGRALENLVFLNLRRQAKEVYYFRSNGTECDFVTREGTRVLEAIQVTTELSDDNRERELDGMLAALSEFDLPTGLMITLEQEEELEVGGRVIKVVPIYKWLLTPST